VRALVAGHSGQPFSEVRVEKVRGEIANLFQREGYFNAKVTADAEATKNAEGVVLGPEAPLIAIGSGLGVLAVRIRNEMRRDLLAASDKMTAWNDLGEQARQLAWVTGLMTAARHLAERPDIHKAFVNAAILELAPQCLQYESIDAAEIAVIETKHSLELDAIWSRYAGAIAAEFAVEDLMAVTPLGSADLAAAWFDRAPELVNKT